MSLYDMLPIYAQPAASGHGHARRINVALVTRLRPSKMPLFTCAVLRAALLATLALS